MRDRFEDFVRNNRDGFDNLEPDPSVWKDLKKEIHKESSFRWKVFLRRAAIVLVIFSASYAVNELMHQIKNDGGEPNSANVRGFKKTEAYYTRLVNQKLNELKPVIENCPSLQEEIDYDMSELDSVYADLKRDLKDNMANQEVIEAIIENYRLKVSILEDILRELSPLDEECIPNNAEYEI